MKKVLVLTLSVATLRVQTQKTPPELNSMNTKTYITYIQYHIFKK